MQDLGSGIKGKHQMDMAIMDFSKAFDTVPHKRLIHKLEYYGIHSKTQNWIKNFLQDRFQKVVEDGESSNEAPVISG